MASPPLATLATAALGVTMGVELVVGVVWVFEGAVVALVTSVRFELGTMIEEVLGAAVLDVLRFALVDVDTTVTVDEGIDEVVVLVLVYDGPVESLIVVV